MATPRLRFLEQVASHADPWDVPVERSALEEAFALDVLNKSLIARSQIEQLDKGVTLKRSGAKHTQNPIKAKAALERANAIRVGKSRATSDPPPEEPSQPTKEERNKAKNLAKLKLKASKDLWRACGHKGCPNRHSGRRLPGIVYCPEHQ
jgi:hypothetical protein